MKAFEDGKGRTWVDRIPSQTFAFWPEIVTELRRKDESSMQDLMECDLVIIDDIGADDDPWKQGADGLCKILTRR